MTIKLFTVGRNEGERRLVAEVTETTDTFLFGRLGAGWIHDTWNVGTVRVPRKAKAEGCEWQRIRTRNHIQSLLPFQSEMHIRFPRRVTVRGVRSQHFIATHITNF